MTTEMFLESLTKKERRYLSKYHCAWCETTLNKTDCYETIEPCSEATKIKRMKKCLRSYKPRNTKQNNI